jgi:L-malate glycosyltransferase
MMHKKILFLAPYPINKAPSQRLKYEQYYPYFKEAGYELKTSSFIDEEFWEIVYKPGNRLLKFYYTIKAYFRRLSDLIKIGQFDIVYIHLWVTPFGFPIFEWLVCSLNKRIIYDIDDLIYLGGTSKANTAIKYFKGNTKPKFLIKRAKHVIVCTPILNDFAKKYNINTTDISSTIDTDVYKLKSNYEINEKLIIGWSGSHSTSKYLYLLQDILLQLRSKVDFKLFVIGDSNFNIDGLDVEAIEWERETEVENLLKIDIGLYPLPDEEWVYGKSGLKALQYMALGIPTLATAIGANFRVIEDGVSGFLIPLDEHEKWKDKIIQLANNIDLRRSIGEMARKKVVSQYSIQSNKDSYLEIFKNIISSF